MKKIFWMTLIGLGSVGLFGCPIYSDSGGGGTCGDCYPNTGCRSDYDCPNGQVCSQYNTCIPGGTTTDAGATCTSPSQCPTGQTCGADDHCHPGDCSGSGCPAGYQCTLSSGTLACVATDGGTKDGGGPPPFTGCTSDSQCVASLGAGAKCLDGTCVAPANQCSDATQCPTGEQCVQGVCTPSCDKTHPCPTGFSCDANGTCSGNPNPCGTGTTVCPTNLTCVQEHCVAPCGDGGACPSGLVCVDNGCIPNQKPNFVCSTEGMAGDGKVNDCAVGSTCLHHNCYIACDPDAGTMACKTADMFNICKQVTTGTGTYSVCGSSSNLGSECDPTTGKQCSNVSQVCVDGFCK
jgi:hypothetical protein